MDETNLNKTIIAKHKQEQLRKLAELKEFLNEHIEIVNSVTHTTGFHTWTIFTNMVKDYDKFIYELDCKLTGC